VVVTIDTRPSIKIGSKHREKTKLNFPPKLYTKPKNLPWIDLEPRKTFIINDIEWIGEEDSRSCILMSKNIRARKFSYKGREKKIVPI
jgi:hypothetical protein